MEENNSNSNNEMSTNNSVQEQIQPNKNNNRIIIALIALIVVGVCGYFIYTKFIQKDDTTKYDNTQEQDNISLGKDDINEETIESCSGCKFIYSTQMLYTTWNKAGGEGNNPTEALTPSVLTSGLYDNYKDLVAVTNKNFFLGVKLNSNNEITNSYVCGIKDNVPFCIEGTSTGSNYQSDSSFIKGLGFTCTEVSNSTPGEEKDNRIKCGPWDNSEMISVEVHENGTVQIGIGTNGSCGVGDSGTLICYE